MARTVRKVTAEDLRLLRLAIRHLEAAKGFLVAAGAQRAAGSARAALRSAQGAQRHAVRVIPLAYAPEEA